MTAVRRIEIKTAYCRYKKHGKTFGPVSQVSFLISFKMNLLVNNKKTHIARTCEGAWISSSRSYIKLNNKHNHTFHLEFFVE